jgi:hypothetical protein
MCGSVHARITDIQGQGPALVCLDSITSPQEFVEIPTIMELKQICIFLLQNETKPNLNKQYNIGMMTNE